MYIAISGGGSQFTTPFVSSSSAALGFEAATVVVRGKEFGERRDLGTGCWAVKQGKHYTTVARN